MKKILLFTAIAFISININAQKSNIDKDLKMYSMVWNNIINKGDMSYFNTKYFDENVTLVTAPENVVSIDALRGYWEAFLAGFSEVEFTIINSFGQGDDLVKHWQFKGKHTGNFFGIPASGNMVDMQGTTMIKMKNGKIAREEDFFDSSVMMQQLGAASSPNNVAVVESLYDNFSVGDVPAVLALMDENIVWNEAEGNHLSDGNPYIGPGAVLNGVFARVIGEHEYFKLKDIKLHNMNNHQVLATLRYDGKMKHNGAIVDAQAAHLWTLSNGKIVAFQQYANTLHLAEAKAGISGLSESNADDIHKIKAVVRDYLEGLDTNDPDRLTKALHPNLAKRSIEKDKEGHDFPSQMSAEILIGYAKDFDFSLFYKAGVDADMPLKVDVDILGISNGVTTVTATSNKFEFIDHIHLGKLDGEWKIINILWAWTGNTNKWLSGSK